MSQFVELSDGSWVNLDYVVRLKPQTKLHEEQTGIAWEMWIHHDSSWRSLKRQDGERIVAAMCNSIEKPPWFNLDKTLANSPPEE